MKSFFCIDLQRFMLIPTKFPLSHNCNYRKPYFTLSAEKIIFLGREKYFPRQGIILSSLMTFWFAIFFAKVVRNNYSP